MRIVSAVTFALLPMVAAAQCPVQPDNGGVVTSAVESSSTYLSNEPPLKVREWPADPPRIVTCRRSEQIISVPAENGGERQIKITRC